MRVKSTNWLKQRREELKLSQEDMAARLQLEGLNVSRSMVSHWENGRYNLPVDDASAMRVLAKVLQVTVSDLLVSVGYDAADSDLQIKLSLKERQAIEAWRRGDITGVMKIIISE